MKDYRRLGLASQLMDQLHHQMQLRTPQASSVGLHVRVSNKAATRLYEETMGYHVSQVISGYYQDGEDAYLMRKSLPLGEAMNENQPPSKLPRILNVRGNGVAERIETPVPAAAAMLAAQ